MTYRLDEKKFKREEKKKERLKADKIFAAEVEIIEQLNLMILIFE